MTRYLFTKPRAQVSLGVFHCSALNEMLKLSIVIDDINSVSRQEKVEKCFGSKTFPAEETGESQTVKIDNLLKMAYSRL